MQVEELHQAYQRVRVANSQYGAEPQTCDFYNELHARLGRDPTSIPLCTVDTAEEPEPSHEQRGGGPKGIG